MWSTPMIRPKPVDQSSRSRFSDPSAAGRRQAKAYTYAETHSDKDLSP